MGKHTYTNDDTVSNGALEQMDMTDSIIESIVSDLWTVTGICAADEEGMDAIGQVGGYLNTLVNPSSEGGDPELVLLGVRRWLREMVSDGSSGQPANDDTVRIQPLASVVQLIPMDDRDDAIIELDAAESDELERSIRRHPAGSKLRKLFSN